MSELWQRSADKIVDGYKCGDCSPIEVVDSVLDRIERINPLINAIVTLDVEGARTAAQESQRRWETSGVEGLLSDSGMSRMEFVLRFTLSHPGLSSTIVGTANLAHLRGNIAVAERTP